MRGRAGEEGEEKEGERESEITTNRERERLKERRNFLLTRGERERAVSYTHLTLPTRRCV